MKLGDEQLGMCGPGLRVSDLGYKVQRRRSKVEGRCNPRVRGSRVKRVDKKETGGIGAPQASGKRGKRGRVWGCVGGRGLELPGWRAKRKPESCWLPSPLSCLRFQRKEVLCKSTPTPTMIITCKTTMHTFDTMNYHFSSITAAPTSLHNLPPFKEVRGGVSTQALEMSDAFCGVGGTDSGSVASRSVEWGQG